ncbi:hypothetical protein O9992_07870 [Vibrio lentus]|nr:hypothetical protein [Vibrio lentus]
MLRSKCTVRTSTPYPKLLAAVEMDDTGSTRVSAGKYVFNHPFFIPAWQQLSTAVAIRLRIRRSVHLINLKGSFGFLFVFY